MDEELLRSMYYDQGLSVPEIARRLGIPRSTISYCFYTKFGLKGRRPEDYPPREPRHIDLSPEALDILNGELLGDGCLRQRSKQAAFFAYHTSCYEYLHYLVERLQVLGLEFGPLLEQKSPRGYTSWHVESKSYAELALLRQRWYPQGKKVVPGDFRLSPLTALHWYLGDGSLINISRGKSVVVLSTNAFSDDDRRRLLLHLHDAIGVLGVTDRQGRVIFANSASMKKWFLYLPACPVRFYRYKWPQ